MKRVLGLGLLCILFVATASTGNLEPQRGPLNPEFLRYLEREARGDACRITSTGHGLGYVPPPMQIQTSIPQGFDRDQPVPEVYDLRDEGLVTPVGDQGTCGSCWTFAAMGALESRWLKLGYDAYDLSENNLNYGHGFEWEPCEGGNGVLATSYFSRGDGPVSEADDPYQGENGSYHPGLPLVAYVPDARFLPPDPMVLKQTVYDNGAITTNMWWDDIYYNPMNYTYYCNLGGDAETNHCVLIVGWDDNMPTAGGVGAWIIKNSWGSGWGEAGYFYISYQDTRVNGFNAYWPDRMEHSEDVVIHYYDRLGWVYGYGWGDWTDYGLAKFQFTGDEQISRVGTWVNPSGSTISIDIYDSFDGTTLSNLITSIPDQVCDYAGYYFYDLSSPLEVHSGDDIYVKVKYDTPSYNWPIPVEGALGGYADPEIEIGKCWVSSTGTDGTWFQLGNDVTDGQYDLCIKLYGSTEGGSEPTTLLDEGFDGDVFPPMGWTTIVTNTQNTWFRGNPTGHSFTDIDPASVASALCPWIAEDQDEWLITPPITLSGASATLDFYAGYSTSWLTYATLKLHVSDDGGSSWTELWEAVDDGGAWDWRPVSVDLSDYTTRDEIKLAWQYVGNDGDLVGIDAVIVRVILPSDEPYPPAAVNQLFLGQNFPNPFNAQTAITFWLPESQSGERATLKLYDIHGRLVRTLFEAPAAGGQQRVLWDGTGHDNRLVPPGTYLYRLVQGSGSQTRRLVLYR